MVDHAEHTPYSNPGRFGALLDDVPTDPAGLSAVARNVIVHYHASGHELPTATQQEINARWVERILAADQDRHPWPLDVQREVTDRVQGCCRDHTLLCVAALRSHGIPARSRVGFAGYFIDGWHHDHVVVEAWLDERWRRFDAEVEVPGPALVEPMDMPSCPAGGNGFVTAAQAWSAFRQGDLDAEAHGVGPELLGFRGPWFLFDEVIIEVAHRFGDELLLWDGWGRIGEPDRAVGEEEARWLDETAALLLAADDGDPDAEARLLARYRADDGLHPGPSVMQASPYGDPPVLVDLTARR